MFVQVRPSPWRQVVGLGNMMLQVNGAVSFVPRTRLVGFLGNMESLALSGRGAACPG